jgi:hypothetical protein
MNLSFELMAPLMFAGLIVFLLIGYPVAFSLSFVGLGFGFIAIYFGHFDFVLLQALPERYREALKESRSSLNRQPTLAGILGMVSAVGAEGAASLPFEVAGTEQQAAQSLPFRMSFLRKPSRVPLLHSGA